MRLVLGCQWEIGELGCPNNPNPSLCTFDCGKVSVSCIQFAGLGGEERVDLVSVSSNGSSPAVRTSVEIAPEELFDMKALSDSN